MKLGKDCKKKNSSTRNVDKSVKHDTENMQTFIRLMNE